MSLTKDWANPIWILQMIVFNWYAMRRIRRTNNTLCQMRRVLPTIPLINSSVYTREYGRNVDKIGSIFSKIPSLIMLILDKSENLVIIGPGHGLVLPETEMMHFPLRLLNRLQWHIISFFTFSVGFIETVICNV